VLGAPGDTARAALTGRRGSDFPRLNSSFVDASGIDFAPALGDNLSISERSFDYRTPI
jgi:hypothetical protein